MIQKNVDITWNILSTQNKTISIVYYVYRKINSTVKYLKHGDRKRNQTPHVA